jgi:hypothetical protein
MKDHEWIALAIMAFGLIAVFGYGVYVLMM